MLLGIVLILSGGRPAPADERTDGIPITHNGDSVTLQNAGRCLTHGAMYALLAMQPCDPSDGHQRWALSENFNHEPGVRFVRVPVVDEYRQRLCMGETYGPTPFVAANDCHGDIRVEGWFVSRAEGGDGYTFEVINSRFGDHYCLTFETAANAVTIKPCGGAEQIWQIVG